MIIAHLSSYTVYVLKQNHLDKVYNSRFQTKSSYKVNFQVILIILTYTTLSFFVAYALCLTKK